MWLIQTIRILAHFAIQTIQTRNFIFVSALVYSDHYMEEVILWLYIQVAATLHCDAMKISSLYIKLMKDKTLTVLEGLIEHLPQAMIEFSHAAKFIYYY